jgi:hypothetical protein
VLCVWRSKSRKGTPRRSWYRNPSFAESSRSGALSRILYFSCIELDVNGIRSSLGTCACKDLAVARHCVAWYHGQNTDLLGLRTP